MGGLYYWDIDNAVFDFCFEILRRYSFDDGGTREATVTNNDYAFTIWCQGYLGCSDDVTLELGTFFVFGDTGSKAVILSSMYGREGEHL